MYRPMTVDDVDDVYADGSVLVRVYLFIYIRFVEGASAAVAADRVASGVTERFVYILGTRERFTGQLN